MDITPATTTAGLTELFGDPISTYTRTQAIEDGMLIDATEGDFAEVTRQHFGSVHVAMTSALFELIKKAVEHPRHCNDWRGVWHDICWMSRVTVARGGGLFIVIIAGTGRIRNHILRVECGATDEGAPALTYMLRDES